MTRAAVLYVFRVMVDDDIPMNAGCLRPINIVIPKRSMLSPEYPAAVVAGNVETSQAVTNCLFGALGALAAAQGTMNNLNFGNATYQYYETICSGSPAGPGFPGTDAVHTHMTNTRLTDPEVLEFRYPVVLEDFHIRKGSGGRGKWNAGDGVRRTIRFLEKMDCTILSGHRRVRPFGLAGGEAGQVGENSVRRKDGIAWRSSSGGAGHVAAGRPRPPEVRVLGPLSRPRPGPPPRGRQPRNRTPMDAAPAQRTARGWPRSAIAACGVRRGTASADRGDQPMAAAHAHEGPDFGELVRSALGHAAAVALDRLVVERVAHRDGGVVGVALAPGLGEIALQSLTSETRLITPCSRWPRDPRRNRIPSRARSCGAACRDPRRCRRPAPRSRIFSKALKSSGVSPTSSVPEARAGRGWGNAAAAAEAQWAAANCRAWRRAARTAGERRLAAALPLRPQQIADQRNDADLQHEPEHGCTAPPRPPMKPWPNSMPSAGRTRKPANMPPRKPGRLRKPPARRRGRRALRELPPG